MPRAAVCFLFSSAEQQFVLSDRPAEVGLQTPPFSGFLLARRQNARATLAVCVWMAALMCLFPFPDVDFAPGVWQSWFSKGPASHSLCVSRMWTVFHSFANVYPEASSFSGYFSSSEQKLIFWIISPFSFRCNINFEENFKIRRKDVRLLSSFGNPFFFFFF